MPGTGPKVLIVRNTNASQLAARIKTLGKLAAFTGVPAASRDARSTQLTAMAAKTNSKKKKAYLAKAAEEDVTNAELMFIHTYGSKIRHIPARPVLQPAVMAEDNKKAIANELVASIRATLEGDPELAEKKMLRAALAGQNAARKWFTDARNGWEKNADSTIARKGSDRPLIDTGALRASIVGIIDTDAK